MDADRFDHVARSLFARTSRRTALGLTLGGLLGAGSLAEGEAKKGKGKGKGKEKGKKKVTICHQGQTLTVAQSALKGHLKHGDTQGPCPSPLPPPAETPFTEIACAGPTEGDMTGVQRVAQSFVANGTGTISTAKVQFAPLSAGYDFRFEIRTADPDGKPTATILGTAVIPNVAASAIATFLTGTFSPAVPVTINSSYALAVIGETPGFVFSARHGNDCAGTVFASQTEAIDFGPEPNYDLIFTVSP